MLRIAISVDGTSSELRSGMTASVTVHCANVPNALQVPVQAIYSHGPKFFCFVYNGGQWKAQEVKAGPTNDKYFVIESGLKEGDQVAINPRAYLADVNLPKLPAEEIQRAVPQVPSAQTADDSAKPGGEKVAVRPDAGGKLGASEMKANGGKAGVEGRRRRPGGDQPGGGSPTADGAAIPATPTKPAATGAAQ